MTVFLQPTPDWEMNRRFKRVGKTASSGRGEVVLRRHAGKQRGLGLGRFPSFARVFARG